MDYDLTTWLAFAEKLPPIGYVVASHKEIPVTHKGAADPTALIIALLARSISNLKGVIVLARAGFVVEARTCVRCLFENLFIAGGLVTRGSDFVQEMFQDELNSRKLRGSIVLQWPVSDKEFEERLRAHIEQMKRAYPKTRFLAPKRASDSSPLAANYLFYSQLSSDSAHPSFSALSRYFRFTENGEELRGIDISPKIKNDELADTVNLACHAFIGVLVAVNQILGDPCNERINPLVAEYRSLAGIAGGTAAVRETN